MLPSPKSRREQVVFAIAAAFLLCPFSANASLIPMGAVAQADDLLAFEQANTFGAEERLSSDRAPLRQMDFGQLFFVERGANSPTTSASTERSEPTRGETLRHVLRSVATIHSLQQRQWYGPARGLQKQRSSFDEVSDDGEWRGFAELLLDSEAIGALTRSLVEIKSADSDNTVFSVLGFGEFVLDVTPSVHAATLTDLSSGLSVGTPLGADYSVYANYGFNGVDGRGPREKVDVVRVVWDWILDAIFSPVGLLASMVAGIALVLWLFMKSANLLQGRRVSR